MDSTLIIHGQISRISRNLSKDSKIPVKLFKQVIRYTTSVRKKITPINSLNLVVLWHRPYNSRLCCNIRSSWVVAEKKSYVMRNPLFEQIIKISAESSKMSLFPKRIHFQLLGLRKFVKYINWGHKKLWFKHFAAPGSSSNSMNGLVNWKKIIQLYQNQRHLFISQTIKLPLGLSMGLYMFL